jgi:DNA-binding transcriptional LysR family regulator
MEVRQLTYFSSVFRQGSITRAAEELMISQPALTRQIRQFEREIGTPLFNRVPTGMTPTAAGAALYRHALTILDLVDNAAEVAALAAPVMETVEVGLAPGLPADWVDKLLTAATEQVSLARINFTDADSTTQLRMLREGRLDIALIHQPPPAGLTSQSLRQEPFGVAVRPGEPAPLDETCTMKQLDGLRVLVHARNQLPIGHDRLVTAAHEVGATPQWQFSSYTEHAAACADAADANVAIMTRTSAARLLPGWTWLRLVDPAVALETWCARQSTTRPIVASVDEAIRNAFKNI